MRLTPTESHTTPPPQVPAPPDPRVVRVTAQGVNLPDDVPTGGTTGDGARVTADPMATSAPDDGGAPLHPADDDGSPAAAAGRRALREARRQRRWAMWLCAAVVALCLGLTIVVVTLARYRPLNPSSMPTATATVLPATVRTPAPVLVRVLAKTAPSRGAPAPEGGNP